MYVIWGVVKFVLHVINYHTRKVENNVPRLIKFNIEFGKNSK